MTSNACTIVIEPLADGTYRATCHFLPDCVTVATTPEAARRGVEEAIALHLHERSRPATTPSDGSDPEL
jgi:predicted RNase H-like HicB family nuclease